MSKMLFLAIILLLVTSCTTSQHVQTSIPPTDPPPPTTDVKATLMATDPSIEVTFNGEECIVEGPNEIAVGVHVFVFHNQHDRTTYLVPIRHYPGNS